MDVEIENAKKGQVKPAVLSVEERNTIIRLGVEKEKKETEALYWLRIGILYAQGYNEEEAREKIYQDLVDKGDMKRAKMMREFQDEVHPLKPDNQGSPISPQQPPPSPQP